MSKQRRAFRYWLQQLHLWIGLILLLPLVMMGVTGAVLVYGHDIEHLLGQGEPPARTVGEWRSPGELIEAARAASKDPTRIPIAVRWPMEVGEPAAVRLSRPGMAGGAAAIPGWPAGTGRWPPGPGARPRTDAKPVRRQPAGTDRSGVAAGARDPAGDDGLAALFDDLHCHLFISGGLGRELVGWLGVALLVLGCSGLYLWWPRPGQWKAAFIVATWPRACASTASCTARSASGACCCSCW